VIIAFLLNRWVVLVLGLLFMLIGLKSDWLLKVMSWTGKMGWAESRLGQGGSYTVWRIIGILAPIAALIYFFSGGVHLETQVPQDEPAGYYQNY
jgi:hypothetical protein